jgi:translation initiation factor 5
MLNINGKVDDSYRYKMPALKSTINGKGNGIFTIVTNINDVSKYINQPPTLLLKFLSVYNGSMANEEKMSITGGYSSDELQKALQVYINRFVICPKCGVPETIPQLKKESKKNVTLELKCSSCGTVSPVTCNNKNEMKASELIIKYLEKNNWSISTKGTMVTSDSKTSIVSKEDASTSDESSSADDEDEINPFG